jgi:hypothetical protein
MLFWISHCRATASWHVHFAGKPFLKTGPPLPHLPLCLCIVTYLGSSAQINQDIRYIVYHLVQHHASGYDGCHLTVETPTRTRLLNCFPRRCWQLEPDHCCAVCAAVTNARAHGAHSAGSLLWNSSQSRDTSGSRDTNFTKEGAIIAHSRSRHLGRAHPGTRFKAMHQCFIVDKRQQFFGITSPALHEFWGYTPGWNTGKQADDGKTATAFPCTCCLSQPDVTLQIQASATGGAAPASQTNGHAAQ